MPDWPTTSAADMDVALSTVADPLLGAAGFTPGARRRWVRSFPPVRHVFELSALKGGQLVTCWGFSLDFVPHLKGKALGWHRTEKSAALDLVYDPVDFHQDWQNRFTIDSMNMPSHVRDDAAQVLPVALEMALAWLGDARDLPSVLERAEWLRTADRAGGRFKFHNVIQQPLAYAFLLARTGKLEAARPVLGQWIARMDCEPHRAKLMALLEG